MKRLSALIKESVSNELARQVNTPPYRFISFRGVEGALGLKGTLCFCWKKGYFEKKVGGNLSSSPLTPPPGSYAPVCN